MNIESVFSIAVLVLIVLVIGKAICDIKFGVRDRQNIFINDLWLVYHNGEPYFHLYMSMYAKGIEIGFYDPNAQEGCHYKIRLRKMDGGWCVRLEVPDVLPQKVGLIQPKVIWGMAVRINIALQGNRKYDLGSEMGNWRVFEGTNNCSIQPIPDLENIAPIPDNFPNGAVLLTYQNDKPIFFQSGQIGRLVVIEFGQCWFSDHNRAIATYSLEMKRGDTGWLVVENGPDIEDRCDWYETYWLDGSEESASRYNNAIAKHFLEQKAKVADLAADCNRSIQNGESFDFAEHVQFWQRWDKHFDVCVAANILFLE